MTEEQYYMATQPVPSPKKKNEMADLFEVPKATDNDMDTSDLFEVPKETDDDINVDDLVELDVERDVMGGDLSDLTSLKPRKKRTKPRPKRTVQPAYYQTGVRGLNI